MSNIKETVQPGKYVELGYDLYTVAADGKQELVHQTNPEDPERIIFGVTPGVIEPLAAAIENKEAGAAFDVEVPAEKAFGPHNPEEVMSLDKDLFVVDGKFDAQNIRPGAIVPMMTSDGYRINGVVVEVGDDKVKMDFNHPLAGKNLRFAGKVLAVRDATPEELHPGCGGGHCGDSCGCDDGCDCGDNCECGEGSGCGCK